MRRLAILLSLGVLSAYGNTLAATVAEHDLHTLIVKLAPQIDGKALARQITAVKNTLPSLLPEVERAGVVSLRPLFPIPPRGVKNERIYDSLEMGQYFVANLQPSVLADTVMPHLRALPAIGYVEFNYLSHLQESAVTPNDPLYPWQWHYAKMSLPAAWQITRGSNTVLVGVVDAGIDYLHPDLQAKIAVNAAEYFGVPGVDDDGNGFVDDYRGWNFAYGNNDPYDDNSHGTHVSGTIGAATDNSLGVSGVDWNCMLLAVKVLNSSGTCTDAASVEGLYFATNNGARVINYSIGGPVYNTAQEAAVNYAYSTGVLVVAAMGNANTGAPWYPAASQYVLAVGATDSLDRRWVWNDSSGSNYGSHIDVVAPGDYILSTYPSWFAPSPYYGTNTGTSMAAPHVSGLAALILAVRPSFNADSLYKYILLGAVDRVGTPTEDVPGWDMYYGRGRVNAYNSLMLATGQCVCLCHGDPKCDGVRDVLDVVATVARAFRGDSPRTSYGCPREWTDMNGDGPTDVIDVVRIVNVAFRGGTNAANICTPCTPQGPPTCP